MARALGLVVVLVLAAAGCGRYGFSPDAAIDTVDEGGVDASRFPADWWDPSFAHRSRIDILGSKLDAGVTDFPLFVHLDATGIDLGAIASTGADLRILDADQKTELPYEIESSDATGYDLWIRVPTIRGRTVDEVAWAYYGNPGAPAPMTAEAVWTGPATAVWHLATGRDSTSNHTDGVINGTLAVPGLTHDAMKLTGTIGPGFLAVPATAPLDQVGADGTGTWSGWVNLDTIQGAGGSLVERRASGGSTATFSLGVDSNGRAIGTVFNANADIGTVNGLAVLPTSTWMLLAMTWDPTHLQLWVDGQVVAQTPLALTMRGTTDGMFVGAGCTCDVGPANYHFLAATIDEVRVERGTRDQAWFAAEITNLRDGMVTVTRADP